jgi:hypothetical protein
MAAVFGVIAALATIWSAVRYDVLRRELVETLPPQFQDWQMSRYAVPVYALASSTPLELQAEYIKISYGSCVAFLAAALALFASGNAVLGVLLFLFMLCPSLYYAFKSWKTYQENRARVNDSTE